jgi:hypothetical protein
VAIVATRILKTEVIVGECVSEEEYTDKMESENNEDILPGFKTFEEFREVG